MIMWKIHAHTHKYIYTCVCVCVCVCVRERERERKSITQKGQSIVKGELSAIVNKI